MSRLIAYREWLRGDGPHRATKLLNLTWLSLVTALWIWVAAELALPDTKLVATAPGSGISIVLISVFLTLLLTAILGVARLFVSPSKEANG